MLKEAEIEDLGDVYQKWNEYQKDSVTSGINGGSGSNVTSVRGNDTNDTMTLQNIYNTINETNLQGRDLELFFPLYLVSHFLGKDIFKETLEISKEIAKSRKEADIEDSKDVQLIEFISQYSLMKKMN